VPQYKYIRVATGTSWYNGNRQINQDLGVPYLADHIRSLKEFRLRVSWCRGPLSLANLQILAVTCVDPGRLKRKQSFAEVTGLVEAA
jgi:hypothetical protein